MSGDSSERFVLLNHLADEFAERYRRGERPALQAYIDRHPELADDIREFFPAMVEMEQVKEDRDEVTEPPTSDPLPTRECLGDYRIIREIGRGGMGVVYEAEQESLGRRVALKVLPAGALIDPLQVHRFEREAKAAARLHHTNIVPVFGVGQQDRYHYYVMQFIAGLGLDLVLEDLKRLRHFKAGRDVSAAPEPKARERHDSTAPSRLTCAAADVARSLITGRFAQNGSAPGGVPATEPFDAALATPRPPDDNQYKSRVDSSVLLRSSSQLSAMSDSDRRFS
jgi:Protein kinase domain